MKKLKTIILELAILVYLTVTLGFMDKEQSGIICSGVDVIIENTEGNYFIEKHDIVRIVKNKYPNLQNIPVDSVDILMLGEVISQHQSVEYAYVYSLVNGTLVAKVIQRKPIARIINNKNQSYYIDDKAKLMPLSSNFTSRVMVVTGDIGASVDIYDNKEKNMTDNIKNDIERLHQIYLMIEKINKNEFMQSLVEQIHVETDGSFIIVPKVGPRAIEFGNVENCDDKFAKLELFYKKGLNVSNWKKYNKLNLKFNNQVVCTKI